MPTDKQILMKGLKYLSGALPLFFLGPVVIHSSFKNQSNPFFIPVLAIGVIFCFAGIFLMFFGLKTIMKSMVD
ncbi:DUF6095 family protein [Flavobacterium psychrotrophum]|uniref:DUF6095 family protein n=1 Tax=Flavobacterium psychrotrophum TaxID=2294119 RepID=UPI000E312802|nr:DUF6095 family protein [Flavobacterium psychrotrophum]